MTRWATPSSVIQDSGSIYKNRYRNNAKLQTYKTEGFSLIGNAKKILYFLPVILLRICEIITYTTFVMFGSIV